MQLQGIPQEAAMVAGRTHIPFLVVAEDVD